MGEEMISEEASRRVFVRSADRIEEERAEAEAEQPPMPADPFTGLSLDPSSTRMSNGGQDDIPNVGMPAA